MQIESGEFENFKLESHDEVELIELTKDLIRIPSCQKDGNEIYEFVRRYLEGKGLNVRSQMIENPYIEYMDFSNLYVTLGNGKGPKIMLNCHLDTVPVYGNWFNSPYSGIEEGDQLFGLGAADMKGGCAVAIFTMVRIAKLLGDFNGRLFLSCVFGEEAPFSLGADTLLREYGLREYDLIIVTEPSPLLAIHDYCLDHKKIHTSEFPVLIVGAEGRVLFEIEFFGKSSHASHPSQGINALHDAAKVISEFARFDVYSNIKMGRGHYCVINVEGGDASFTVPGYCKILVNRQLTLGETEKAVMKEIRMIIRSLRLRSKVSVKKRYSPSKELEYRPYLYENSNLIQVFQNVIRANGGRNGENRSSLQGRTTCRFTTSSVGDFNLFATRTSVPTIIFGPGGGNIHTPNEFVSKREIIESCNYLIRFLMTVFHHSSH